MDPEGVTVTFVTDKVDQWHDRLIDYGASVEGPPEMNEDFKIYNFFARDPDGTRLEFQRFSRSSLAGARCMSGVILPFKRYLAQDRRRCLRCRYRLRDRRC